jgi:CRISPR-associated exonuclease Cas4
LYYLYRLKQKGIYKKGRLEVFEKRKQDKKRIFVELDEENEKKLLEIIEDIEKIINSPMPEPVFESKCKRCAYYEFCFL